MVSGDCLFKRLIAVLCCLCGSLTLAAQELPAERFVPDGTLCYQLYFKWGVLMPKAGKAALVVEGVPDAGHAGLLYLERGLFIAICD